MDRWPRHPACVSLDAGEYVSDERRPVPRKAFRLGRLRRQNIRVVGRLVHVDGKRLAFASGEMAEGDAVIWATGYRDDRTWVAIPEVKDGNGVFAHWRGTSPLPSLYFIGRSWQWTRGSALLHGVGHDAAYVVSRIAEQIPERVIVEEDSRAEMAPVRLWRRASV